MTARIAGGIGLVGCTAIVAVTIGGSGLFGGLGSLFGRGSEGPALQVAKAQQQDADIVAAPPRQPARAAGPITAPQRMRQPAASPPRRRTPISQPPPSSGPPAGPIAQPAPPPTIPAPPSPGRGQVVTTVSQAVQQVTEQAPPQAAPVTRPVEGIVGQLVQTCQGLPVCP